MDTLYLIFRIDDNNFSAIIGVAKRINHGVLNRGIAGHVLSRLTSDEKPSLHLLNEAIMEALLEAARMPEEDKLKLLVQWFDERRGDSSGTLEGSVGRLMEKINCRYFDSSFVMNLLLRKRSSFVESKVCR